jgi:hypothetical protein
MQDLANFPLHEFFCFSSGILLSSMSTEHQQEVKLKLAVLPKVFPKKKLGIFLTGISKNM